MTKKRMETAKRGKAGELQVAGELLRCGYDVFVPFVDAGIDLVNLRAVPSTRLVQENFPLFSDQNGTYESLT